jgi:hypothetical protein
MTFENSVELEECRNIYNSRSNGDQIHVPKQYKISLRYPNDYSVYILDITCILLIRLCALSYFFADARLSSSLSTYLTRRKWTFQLIEKYIYIYPYGVAVEILKNTLWKAKVLMRINNCILLFIQYQFT